MIRVTVAWFVWLWLALSAQAVSPTLDASAQGVSNGTATTAVTVTPTVSNDFIVVFASNEVQSGSPPSVSSVSSTGQVLTWTKRQASGTRNSLEAEEWWQAQASNTTAIVITVHWSGNVDNGIAIGTAWKTINTTAPWDPNASLNGRFNSATTISAPTITGLSTTNADDTLLFFDNSPVALPSAPTGYTTIQSVSATAGAGNWFGVLSSLAVSATQSNLTITGSATVNTWVAGADALTNDSSATCSLTLASLGVGC